MCKCAKGVSAWDMKLKHYHKSKMKTELYVEWACDGCMPAASAGNRCRWTLRDQWVPAPESRQGRIEYLAAPTDAGRNGRNSRQIDDAEIRNDRLSNPAPRQGRQGLTVTPGSLSKRIICRCQAAVREPLEMLEAKQNCSSSMCDVIVRCVTGVFICIIWTTS